MKHNLFDLVHDVMTYSSGFVTGVLFSGLGLVLFYEATKNKVENKPTCTKEEWDSGKFMNKPEGEEEA